MGNYNSGIFIEGGTAVNIGGTGNGQGNLISGNGQNTNDYGIRITGGTDVKIRNNIIGLNATGTSALSNSGPGILLNSSGSGTEITDNTISASPDLGISILSVSGNEIIITGNKIGTDINGDFGVGLGNSGSGISISNSSGADLANPIRIASNIISGNGTGGFGHGITEFNSGNIVIESNLIGVESDGTSANGNDESGINLTNGTNIQIGGVGVENVLAHNGDAGIITTGTGFGSTQDIRINSYFCNLDLGVNIPNLVPDVDPPVITGITSGSISGTSTEADLSVVEIYEINESCADNQGAIYVGSTTVGGGTWSLNTAVNSNAHVATVTDATNGISEFSASFDAPNLVVTNLLDDTNPGSLRWAVGQANTNAGADDIIFSLTEGSVIPIGSALIISSGAGDGTTIDGDMDGDGDPDITLSGGAYVGIEILANNCTINGLNMVGFGPTSPSTAIEIDGSSGNTITGNYIGTNNTGSATGTTNYRGVSMINAATGNFIGDGTSGGSNVISNNSFGVYISGSNNNTVSGNIIGLDVNGTTDLGNSGSGVEVIGSTGIIIGVNGDERNLISGNGSEGISLTSSSSATIVNNYIGTDISGNVGLGNDNQGILLSASTASVGDGALGGRNVISDNADNGLEISSDNNTILGNYIGVGADGTTDLGNSTGIWINVGATGNAIGDGTSGGRNLISGNNVDGINVRDVSTLIYGNYIGTNANGDAAVGNTRYGVFVSAGGNSEIGDAIAGYGNLISGNGTGVRIIVPSNTVLGNYIGTDVAGMSAIANVNEGIVLTGSGANNTIGDGTALGSNLISSNGADGILLDGASATGNVISQNSIHSNTTEGINIVNGAQNGVTVPVITANSSVTIGGTSDNLASVDVFADAANQGEHFIGTTIADGSGNWSLTYSIASIPAGLGNATAIQTSGGNSSEFGVAAALPLGSFVTTWSTTDGQILIPIGAATYNYNVMWTNLTNPGVGEGSVTGQTGSYAITGLTNGDIYQLEITGTFPRIWTRYNSGTESTKILTVEQWGDISWTNMTEAFYDCPNLTVPATDAPDLSGVTSLESMFYNCTSLNNPMDHWDVSTINDFSSMFYVATAFNQNLNSWTINTTPGVLMESMFNNATLFNGNISSWNVIGVTNMSHLFANADSFTGDISGWDTDNVTTMHTMFGSNTAFNGVITNWNVGNVIDMGRMFQNATAFNQDLNWDVSSVTNFGQMFEGASAFTGDLSGWTGNFSINPINMGEMFKNATVFNSDISSWDFSTVTSMAGMFENADTFDQNINNWDVSSVTNLSGTFQWTDSFNQPLGNWVLNSSANLSAMFYGTVVFDQDISSWTLTGITNLFNMFSFAAAFNQPIGTWDVSTVTNMGNMFQDAPSFNQDLGAWDISSVSAMGNIFNNTAMSTANYDATLIGWADDNGGTETIPTGITLGAAGVTYCTAAPEWSTLDVTFSWTINDAGLFCPPYEVINTNDSGTGSLRWAITNANASTGETISFNIPGGGPWIITIEASSLPTMTSPVVLDATTQPGWDMDTDRLIEIDGATNSINGFGLQYFGGGPGVEIYGFKVTGFSDEGIYSFGGGAIIGANGKGNVINGNGGNGITVLSTDNMIIRGNRIGTNYDGTSSVPNGTGIAMAANSSNAIIGGPNPGDGNLISGNSNDGISTNNSGPHTIQGNIIGLNAAGNAVIANGLDGISLSGDPSHTIQDNIISGNMVNGIYLTGGNQIIIGNTIGTDAGGTMNFGNSVGITAGTTADFDNWQIGTGNVGEGNVIAFNTNEAILFTSAAQTGHLISENSIYQNGVGINLSGVANNNISVANITIVTPIDVTVNGIASGDVIEVFVGDGNGQGQTFIGSEVSTGSTLIIGSLSQTINVNDEIVVTRTDASNNTSEFSSPSGINNSLDFDATNDHVLLTGVGNQFELSNLTVEAWINPQSSTSYILSSENIGGFGFYVLGGTLRTTEVGIAADQSSAVIPTNTWTHVAITYDGSVVKYYKNGVFIDQSTFTLFSTSSNGNYSIGARSTNSQFSAERIDELRIWNTVRSEADFQSTIHSNLTGGEPGLVAYYEFNQGTAGINNAGVTVLDDLTSNNIDGTLTNFILNGATSNWVTSGAQDGLANEPTNLFATEVSGTQIDLSWTDNSFDETGFKIERSDGNNTSFVLINTVGADITTYSDNTVTPGNGYFYRVIATNASGDSGPTNEKFGSTITPPGNALDFDGVNDVIDLGTDGALSLSNQYTFEAWVKWNSFNANHDPIVGRNDGGGVNMKWFFSYTTDNGAGITNKIILHLNGTGQRSYPASAQTILTGQWYHVAFTNSGNDVNFYLNGINIGNATIDVALPTPVAPVELGRSEGFYSNLELDEVRIWDIERTQVDIQNDMLSTLIGSESNLVGYYRFDQSGNFSLLPDRSVNNNTGALTNFPADPSANWIQSQAMAPDAPIAYNATAVTTSDFVASFSVPASADDIWIEVDDNSDFSSTITPLIPVGLTGSATVTVPLTPGTDYYFRVQAQNGAAFSDYGTSNSFRVAPGNALSFLDDNDFVNAGTDASLQIPSTVTLEAWVKRTRIDAIDIILEKGGDWNTSGQTNYGMGLHNNANNNRFYFYFDGGWRGTTGVTDLDWHHYAVVAQEGNTDPILYIDGTSAPIEQSGGSATILLDEFSALDLHLGAQVASPNYFSANIIDEVRIWNGLRSQTDIQNNMFSTLIGIESGLVAYYRFDQGVADNDNTSPPINVLPDLSANSNDAVLINMALDGTSSNWVASNTPIGLEVFNATNVTESGFDANFSVPQGATDMIIDVSDLNDFSSLVVNGMSIGTTSPVTISTPLLFDRQYYYRVRADIGGDISPNVGSNAFQVQPGNALHFNKVNDHVVVQNHPYPTNTVTIEAWVKPESVGSAYIVAWGNTFDFPEAGLKISPNFSDLHIEFVSDDLTGVESILSAGTIPINEWSHVAAVKDGNSVTVYINGIADGSGSVLKTPSVVNMALATRWRNNGANGHQFIGAMDEVKVWNVARSVTELDDNKYLTITGDEPGLLTYYSFDEGIANGNNAGVVILPNLSGNGFNGDILNLDLIGRTSNWVISDALAVESPEIFSATDITTSGFTAEFIPPSGATDVLIDLSDNPVFISPIQTNVSVGLGGTFNLAETLDPGVEYYYRARANHSGELSNNVVSKVFMVDQGNALDFDGGDDFVSIPHNAAHVSNQMTIEFLFYKNNSIIEDTPGLSDLEGLIWKGVDTGPADRNFEFHLTENNPPFRLHFAVGDGTVNTQNEFLGIDPMTWYHVAGVIDGQDTHLYVNGLFIGTSTSPGPINTNAFDIILGKASENSPPERFFNGKIDGLRIWDRVLQQHEIQTRMLTSISNADPNLVGDFRFDQGIGSDGNSGIDFIQDASLLQSDGTLNNFTLMGTTSNWVLSNASFFESPFTYIPTSVTATGFEANFETPLGAIDILIDIDDAPDFATPLQTGISAGTGTGFSVSQPLLPGVDYYYRTTADYGSGNFSLPAHSESFRIQPGNALHFDEVSDHVLSADHPYANNTVTLEAWIRPDQTGDSFFIAWGKGGNFDEASFGINSANQVFFVVNSFESVISSGTVPLNEWSHVAVTKDGTNVTIYINGVADGNGSITGNPDVQNLALGTRWRNGGPNGGQYFGALDEVRIWNVVRSASEINNNRYNTISGSESGLLTYYRFDNGLAANDNSGVITLQDVSRNSYDGTVLNLTLDGNTANWIQSDALAPESPEIYNATDVTIGGFMANFDVPVGATDILIDVDDNIDFSSPLVSDVSAGLGGTFVVNMALTQGTAYYYRTRADHSGQFSNFVVSNGFMVQPGNALDFDGTDDEVISPSVSYTAYTFETWVKFEGSAINKSVLKYTSSGNPGFETSHQIRTDNSGHFVHYTFDGTQKAVVGSTIINLDQWHHVAIVAENAGQARLYVDGNEEGTPVAIGTLWALGDEVRIGLSGPAVAGLSAATFFQGEVDEVCIWNSVRSEAAIQNNMFTTLAGNEPNLVTYYRFDQGIPGVVNTGITTLPDRGTNQNDGTLIGFDLGGADVNISNWVESGAMTTPVELIYSTSDISTALYSGTSLPITEIFGTGLAFNNDGTKMYEVGESGDQVSEYALGTPFDITTATFTVAFSVTDQEIAPSGLVFNKDGTKMYLTGLVGNAVFEYALSTAFDVSSAGYTTFYSVFPETSPTGLAFNNDGSKMFVVGNTGGAVREYGLGTVFDVSSAGFTTSFSIVTEESSSTDLAFNSDGSKMYVMGFYLRRDRIHSKYTF